MNIPLSEAIVWRILLRRFRQVHRRLPEDDDRFIWENQLYIFRRDGLHSWWAGPF